VKFSYNGDANGDGKVNADDYFRIDSNFLTPPANATYGDGDFNFDDAINADDYFLIDSSFLGQGEPLGGAPSATAAAGAMTATTLATSAVVATTGGDEERKRAVKRSRDATASVFSAVRVKQRRVRAGR
jgi:hypothetical protein